ncbi:AraC family transcriptional regulator [Burkholderia pseudomallei]|uniref:AraC family transcriptional regulator n=1 Tax=Burkholderia pseudomallei TaxID=28450 RepID=UPI00016B087A|nr:AraC family transcriptional regulator [Burkholderia pseudomallei]AGZ29892.1 arabinose-binding domain of AraC transcription regulator, N-term family protein [Burkholderia pseudomallei NCTC 13179]ARL08063.1 AraC family transcriptional regulator [Burkholderia pseudomallei]ARL94698.1 AraC family transcriptional regulator [Burkholderia pseudomallei]ARM00719.1 AraC family transcriptional regulator [Burkholderia pseudomallei]KGC93355.1 helix-turn-helix domain protein [Burkholderia pseudomallei]
MASSDKPRSLAARRPASLHAVAVAVDMLQRRGLSTELILSGSGIAPAELRQPNKIISHAQEMVIYHNAWRMTGDSAIGLAMADAVPLTAYMPLGLAMMVSPTLGAAIELANSCPLLALCYFTTRLETKGSRAVITFSDYSYRPDLYVLNTDMCLAGLRRQMFDLLGGPPTFRQVTLAFDAPKHAYAYESLFQCPIRFSAPAHSFTLDANCMNTPLPMAHQLEHMIAKDACVRREQELEQWVAADVVGKALHYLYDHPFTGTVPPLAGALGMSTRTLQRKLKQAGTSLQRLLEQVRRDLLIQDLALGSRSRKDIARHIGYKDPTSVSRARRRWAKEDS